MTLTFSYSKMGERCVYLHEMYGMETAKRCSHCIERVCSEGHVVNEQAYHRPGFGHLGWRTDALRSFRRLPDERAQADLLI